MFRQVVFTLFSLMDDYYDYWSKVGASRAVPTFGRIFPANPEQFSIDAGRMIKIFREGFEHFGALWQNVVTPQTFACLKDLYAAPESDFRLPADVWAKVVYDFSATFHAWERHRRQLVDTMSPLYYARIASFVAETRSLDDSQAEQLVEDQAEEFERLKPYLIERWQARARASSPTA
jgi:hypothetical protein